MAKNHLAKGLGGNFSKGYLGLLAKITNGKYSTGTFSCGLLNERHLSEWQVVLTASGSNGKCEWQMSQ